MWAMQDWRSTFIKTEVLVMTPEICKHFMYHNYFDVSDINCVIIDECHHAFGNDPLVSICSRIKAHSKTKPLILAMTASLIPSKKGEAKSVIAQLEANLYCKLLCYPDVLEDYRKLVPIPNCSLYRYTADTSNFVDVFTAWLSRDKDKEKDRGKGRETASPSVPLSESDVTTEEYDPSAGPVQSNPGALLMFALLRVRHSQHILYIRKFVRTLKMKASDFPILDGLNLDGDEKPPTPSPEAPDAMPATGTEPQKEPSSDSGSAVSEAPSAIVSVAVSEREEGEVVELSEWGEDRQTGLPEAGEESGAGDAIKPEAGPDSLRQSRKQASLLPPCERIHTSINDLYAAIGQTAKVAEECGLLCALQALQICLTSSVRTLATSGLDITHTDNALANPDPDFHMSGRSKSLRKGRYLHSNAESYATIDLEQVARLVGELRAGPFRPEDLRFSEYVSCVSILDCFFALAASLGPQLCAAVRDMLIHSARDKLSAFLDSDSVDATGSATGDKEGTIETTSIPSSENTTNQPDGQRPPESANEVDSKGLSFRGYEYPPYLSICLVLVCALLDILSSGEPVSVPLSPEGVLQLLEPLCLQIRTRHPAFVLTQEECEGAVCDAIAACWRSFPRQTLLSLFDGAKDFEYVPLDPGQADTKGKVSNR